MTEQLSWVDEVKKAGLTLIPAKGHVKAGAHICSSARQTQASSAKNPDCSWAYAPYQDWVWPGSISNSVILK